VEAGNSEGNPVKTNKGQADKQQDIPRQRPPANQHESNAERTYHRREPRRTWQHQQRDKDRPEVGEREPINAQYIQQGPPNLIDINIQRVTNPNNLERIERELGDIINS